MDKKEVVKTLDETATLLELEGADFFKVRAYRSASRALESSGMEPGAHSTVKDLQEIKGIGKNIAGHIIELISNGTFADYERLKTSTPPGLMAMLRIPGMGAKKVRYLFDNLGISDMETLEQACLENSLSVLPGFGKKTQDNILKGIQAVKRYRQKFLYSQVIDQAESILEKVKKGGSVIRASLAGSLRRKKEIIKDIDIVASTDKPEMVMELFTGLDDVGDVIARGSTRSSIRLANGINADIRTVEDWQFPYALHHFTGSREHNTAMRSLAKKSGIKMNEYGLFKGKELIKCKSEKDIFGVFGMQYIPPELRENYGEIEAAQKGQLPALVELSDIKGIIHIHTTYSDGKMTLEQAARKAMDMGFSYIGISEHSRSARYAGGLRKEDIDEYLAEIDRLNQRLEGFTIFKGIESDILNDGSLDYDDRILERFDFVIIAIHSNFNMSKKDMTKRIIKAMQHPYAAILAHPTGRLLLARDPYEADMEEIIDAAAQNNVDLELNSSPFRLDLDWRYGKYTKQKGVKVFINPDAHTLDGLHDYSFGVNIARKGWLEAKDIANTMDAGKMARYLENKKEGISWKENE
jgi:DNA polymerase (family X)